MLKLTDTQYAEEGAFIITDNAWSMTNHDRNTKVETILRSGALSPSDARAIAAQLRATMNAPPQAPSGNRYIVEITLVEPPSSTSYRTWTFSDESFIDSLLPATGAFVPCWRDATAIPKMYWYRDVGPIDGSNAETDR